MPTPTKTDWERLGAQIARRRRELDIHQAKVAAAAEISVASLSRLEHGGAGRIETLFALADVLEWDVTVPVKILAGIDVDTEPAPDVTDLPTKAGFYIGVDDPDHVGGVMYGIRIELDDDDLFATEADVVTVGEALSAAGKAMLARLAEHRSEPAADEHVFVSVAASRMRR